MPDESPHAVSGSANRLRLVLFSKFPAPGAVKTRLIPALGAAGAAALHGQLAQHCFNIISAAAKTGGAICEVRYSGAEESAFREWLGHDGRFLAQSEGDLGDRLRQAAEPLPYIFFGADTPDLNAEIILEAIAALDQHDVVIGPAEDGGYYLVGAKRELPGLFDKMPWSTADLLDKTLEYLHQIGITPGLLQTLRDCDRPEDLVHWPWLTP
ncbi:MAG: TIGR04282 family arsenosugar biosynthesis glycosyltransferase [Pseudomonadota bacterium]